MNEIMLHNDIKIENLVYEIRGIYVMLDSDLAKLYMYSQGTKALNQAVRRNIERFPDTFYFQLTTEEYNEILKSQFVTSSYGGVRKRPYVFTEEGVAMLATILKTKIAAQVSVKIMNTFVYMRKFISSANYEKRISNLETKYIEHDTKFEEIFNKLDKTKNSHIFFDGQIYDAYSILLDVLNSSNKNIIIIDNYVDKNLLDLLSRTKKEVIIYGRYWNKELMNKYKKQYNNVMLKINTSFHDRFIIIDNKILYHSGASFKDLGKKCFALNKIEDEKYLSDILKRLKTTSF